MTETYQGDIAFYRSDVCPIGAGELFAPAIVCFRQTPAGEVNIYFILVKMGVNLPDAESAKVVADKDFNEATAIAEKHKGTAIDRIRVQTEEFKKLGYYPIRDFNRLLDDLGIS